MIDLQYGNPIYSGGGTPDLGGGIPTSTEARAAWRTWVAAVVNRYKNRVYEFEVWNEPNGPGDQSGFSVAPQSFADFALETVNVIGANSSARIIIGGFTKAIFEFDSHKSYYRTVGNTLASGKLSSIANSRIDFGFHPYHPNPDLLYEAYSTPYTEFKNYVEGKGFNIRQDEVGVASEYQACGNGGGALCNLSWDETAQAKYNTRVMLNNYRRNVGTSTFLIIDAGRPGQQVGRKGLILSDTSKVVLRPKRTFQAFKNVTAIFDNSLTPIGGVSTDPLCTLTNQSGGAVLTRYQVYGFTSTRAGYTSNMLVIWRHGVSSVSDYDRPGQVTDTTTVNMTCQNFTFPRNRTSSSYKLRYVDIVTGKVREVPIANVTSGASSATLRGIPVYDGPIVIADQGLIPF